MSAPKDPTLTRRTFSRAGLAALGLSLLAPERAFAGGPEGKKKAKQSRKVSKSKLATMDDVDLVIDVLREGSRVDVRAKLVNRADSPVYVAYRSWGKGPNLMASVATNEGDFYMQLEQDKAVNRRMIISRAGPRQRNKTIAANKTTTIGIYRYSWPEDLGEVLGNATSVEMKFAIRGYLTDANHGEISDYDELFVTRTIETLDSKKGLQMQKKVSLDELFIEAS